MRFLLFISMCFFYSVACYTQNTNNYYPPSLSDAFRNFNKYAPAGALNGAYLSTFNTQENTRGRRYLFDTWVHGTVTNAAGKIITIDSFLYNYDKMSNTLIVTPDKKTIIEVNKNDISSFRLNNNNQDYYFIRPDSIVVFNGFLQVLTGKDPGYTLYKQNNTRFVKADFHTNGIMESGKKYDEYADDSSYYIKGPGGAVKPITLKIKSVKAVFKDESSKVNAYISMHSGEPVNEVYVKGLVDYLNQ